MSTRCSARSERGTAVTETLLLTWILVMFIASVFQLYRVNQAIYSSVVTAHTLMFNGAWRHNCFNKTFDCMFNSDLHAQIQWRPNIMPEVRVQRVGLFQSQLPLDMRLRAWRGARTPRADGVKRTRMGAGTYYPICPCSLGVFGPACLARLNSVPGMGFC